MNTSTNLFGYADSSGPLPCDRYTIQARKDGFFDAGQTVNIVGGFIQWHKVRMSRKACTGENCTPVVLVPGMLGSSSEKWSIYPKLPRERRPPASKLHIHDPRHPVLGYKIAGFDELHENLSSTFDVIDCPWDWRLKIDQAAEEYLIPAIDEALKVSKTGKVHIVAHSTGGLVARAYLQSTAYGNRNDVDKLLFVATPHLGSVNPYYIWEGGDPKSIDDITDNGLNSIANFYSNTIQNLWEETYGYHDWAFANKKVVKYFVQVWAPSLLQLMYTGDFLNDAKLISLPWGTSYPTNVNTRLKELNSDANIGDVMSSDGSGGTKVHAGVIAGNNNASTVRLVNVKAPLTTCAECLYEDGFPTSPYKNGVTWQAGDGTVPIESATYPVTQGWAESVTPDNSTAEHASLIKYNINAIRKFLTGQAASAQSPAMRAFMEPGSSPVSSFSVASNGPVRFLITDPQGRRAGIAPSTGDAVEEIPAADILFDIGQGEIGFENAAEGEYTITYFGQPARDFRLHLNWQDGVGNNGEKKLAGQVPVVA